MQRNAIEFRNEFSGLVYKCKRVKHLIRMDFSNIAFSEAADAGGSANTKTPEEIKELASLFHFRVSCVMCVAL